MKKEKKYTFANVTTEEINAIIDAMDQVAHGAESADDDYVYYANKVQKLINSFLKKKKLQN